MDSTTTPTNASSPSTRTAQHWPDRNMLVQRFGTGVTGGGGDTLLTGNYLKGTNSLNAAASVAPTITAATVEGAAATNHPAQEGHV